MRDTDRTREETVRWLSGEPTIDEMLADPTVITMMKRDGVEPDDVRLLIRRLKPDPRSNRLPSGMPFPAAPFN